MQIVYHRLFMGNIKNISCVKMDRKGLKASVYVTLSV